MRAAIAAIAAAGILASPAWSESAADVCREPSSDAPIPDVAFEEIVAGLNSPTHVTAAFDGTNRLFVVEQAGTIRIVENDKLVTQPFLDIRDRVESGGEKGLLSVAFHPRFEENGRFYVDYTTRIQDKLFTHVSRFTVSASDPTHEKDARVPRALGRPEAADPKSETVLLRIEQPHSNHNGGQLAFGPDGYLYVGMGDGGSANDPHDNGQNLDSFLGKLLRLDVDQEHPPLRYSIPPDNPFPSRAGTRPEIWAFGLRNPWRFSFDAENGRLYLADVGQNAVEEIDLIEKGGNYGWRIMEGDICTPKLGEQCDQRGLTMPIQVYRHPEGLSITGGFVYRGRAIEGLCGTYLYADYITRRVWGLRYDGKRVRVTRELIGPGVLARIVARFGGSTDLPAISSFGEDEKREVYVADHAGGRVLRVIAAKS